MADEQKLKKRDTQFAFRVDRELLNKALDKAQQSGGLSVFLRAAMRALVDDKLKIQDEFFDLENTPAQPQAPSKPRRPRTRKK